MADIGESAKFVISEYTLATSEMSVPVDAPNWVQHVYPALMRNIFNGFNSMVEKMVCGFNESWKFLQKQIDYHSEGAHRSH